LERLVEHELGKTALAISVEQIPNLKEAREHARTEARQIIENHRPDWRRGEFESPILPADPITAAERLLAAEEKFGPDSEEFRQAYQAAYTNSWRTWAEAYRKNIWEYFPPLEQQYDNASGLYQAFGRPLIEVTREGLRWDPHPEERQRLANEHVEEITYHEVGNSPHADTHWVLTISPCPDHAINNPVNGYGYVPEIKKMMIRGVHLTSNPTDPSLKARHTEQAAISGNIISHEIIVDTLKSIGAIDSGDSPSKTKLHGTQLLINKEAFPGGILEIIKLLDEAAGEGVFMGEWQPYEPRNYSSIPRQASARQRLLEEQAIELTEYMIGLASNGADHAWAAVKIEQEVNRLMHARVKSNPRLAREAFDDRTAKGYEAAIALDRQGQYQQADAARINTQEQAPSAAYCGAGSCELRQATATETAHARSLGLTGDILAFAAGRCPKGHRVTLFNMEGSRACSKCQLNEIKKKKKSAYIKQKSKKAKKLASFWFN
jgi:hypothetical protein